MEVFYINTHPVFSVETPFPKDQTGKRAKHIFIGFIYSFVISQKIPSDVLLPVFGERCFSGKLKVKYNERRNLMKKKINNHLFYTADFKN